MTFFFVFFFILQMYYLKWNWNDTFVELANMPNWNRCRGRKNKNTTEQTAPKDKAQLRTLVARISQEGVGRRILFHYKRTTLEHGMCKSVVIRARSQHTHHISYVCNDTCRKWYMLGWCTEKKCSLLMLFSQETNLFGVTCRRKPCPWFLYDSFNHNYCKSIGIEWNIILYNILTEWNTIT